MFIFFCILFFVLLIGLTWWRVSLYKKSKPTGKYKSRFIRKSILWVVIVELICCICLIVSFIFSTSETNNPTSSEPATHKLSKKQQPKQEAKSKKKDTKKNKQSKTKKQSNKKNVSKAKKRNITQLKSALAKLPGNANGVLTNAKLDEGNSSITLTLSDDSLNSNEIQLKAISHQSWLLGKKEVQKYAPYPDKTINKNKPLIYVKDNSGNTIGETSAQTGEFKFKG